MAEFNEHVLKVRAALDKGSQKDMRDVLRGIFTEESHIDFNNPENMRGLRELAEAMKKVFTQAGNKKFDFTKMITLPGPEMFDELKKAALEFNDVWNSIVSQMGGAGGAVAGGIADGIVSGVSAGVDAAVKDAEAKLDGLLKEQAAKIKKIDELTARQRKREDMIKRLDFDNAFEVEEKLKFTDDKDLKQKVRDIESVYEDALFDLQNAADAGKLTEPILEKFKNAAREMLKARNTVAELAEEKIKKTVKQSGSMMQSSKFVSKAEDIFGPTLVERLLGDENDAESLMSEIGQAMELFTEEFDLLGVREEISAVKKELAGIGDEIDRITAQHPELVDRKSAEEAEERLNRIHDAYERLFVTRGAKKGELNESKVKHIENTLAYKGHGDAIQDLPADATDQQLARHTKQSNEARKKLENAFRLYDESAAESWDKRAQYLIKAIAEYESILNNPNASKDLLGGYEDQYEKLRAQATIEREKLETVVSMARGSVKPAAAGDESKVVDMARQAREEEEGRTKAAQQRKAVEDAIAKNKDKEESQSGGILNNPLFANMFKPSNAEETNDDLREQSELLENIQRLASYVDEEYLSAGKHLGDFLDDVQRDASGLDEELKDILTSLKLIDDTGKLQFDVKHAGEEGGGTTHNGALISEDFVLIERKNYEEVKNSQLPEGSGRAREDGINVANVLKYIPSLHTGGFFDVQRTAKGHNLFDGGMLSQDVVEATEEQLEQLVNAFIKARDYGFDIENGGSNIAYDNKEGFSFYDLSEYSGEDAGFWNKLDDDQKKLIAIENLFSLFSGLNRDHGNAKDDPNVTKLAERIKSIIEQRGIISPDAVDEDGRNYEDIYDDVFSGDIDQESDALMAMLEAVGQKRAQIGADAEESLKRQQTETQNLTEDVNALTAAEEKRYDVLLKNKDAIAAMHDTAGESGAFYNSETGEFSDVIAGGAHSVETERSAWQKASEQFDTRIHSHNYDVAAPSFSGKENDFNVWIKGFDIFKKQMILANKEILSFDFSSLESVDTLKEIAKKYKEAATVIDQEFDGYIKNRQVGDLFGTIDNMQEQMQVRLREALENIMVDYKGVMTSIKLPDDMVKGAPKPAATSSKVASKRDSVERYDNTKELEAALAKTEELQSAIDQKTKELAAKDAEIAEANRKVEEAERAERVAQADATAERHFTEEAEEKADMYRRAMDSMQEEMDNLRERYANRDAGTDEEQTSVSSEELKNILSSIVYNVKIAHDDNDKTANKIAIDESVLESTLKRVFSNVLNPHTEQNDSEPKNEPWALEKTLQAVKGVLDGIQTNTAKSESVEVAPAKVEVGNVLATENTLAAIKTAVEAINKKVVKGTKVTTKDSVAKNQADNATGGLPKKYEQLGKLQARAESSGAFVDRERYEQLAREVQLETQLLGLNEQQNVELLSALQLRQEIAYANEKEIETAKEQKRLFSEYVGLTKQLGTLDGIIGSDSTDDIAKRNAQIEKDAIMDMIDRVRPQLDLTREDLSTVMGASIGGEDQSAIKQRQKTLNDLLKIYIKLGEVYGRLDYEHNEDGTKALRLQASQLAEEAHRLGDQIGLLEEEYKILNQARFKAEKSQFDLLEAKAADKEVKKTAAKEAKMAAANAKKMAQREAMLGKAGNAVGRAENTWMNAVGIDGELPDSFVAEIDEYYKKLDTLRKKHQELKNSDIISEEQKKELISHTIEVNKLTEEIGGLISEYQRLSGDNVTVIGTSALASDAGLDAYEQQLKQTVMTATNGKAQIKNFDAATKTLTYTVKTGSHEFTEYTAAVRRADGALVSVQGTTKKAETFIEATKRKMKEISSYMSGMSIISRAGQELRRGIQYVREIDLALTELKKVTNETEEEYDKFLQTAAKTGSRLGTTISAVTEATSTFAKLGYSMEQATEMAEAAIVYKNVGDNIASTEDAADSIISTMKGFKLEATESMAIVDRFNEVGNRFAITSQGIGEALRLSASALNEGGNSLDESIAMITAANEVVNDPSSVGTALKTLTLRLRGSKTELEEMGEDVSDMATTTSALQAKLLALTGGQVDIMLDENTFKNSTQILREMASAWEDMSDIQRASALELMGGKRQANVLSALIQNFDTVEEAIEASANSAGSALEENERYLDSIQGKIDQFNNAMQSMWSNALDSDIVKGIVAFGTELIKIVDDVGLLRIALMGVGMYLTKGMDFESFFKPAKSEMEQMYDTLEELRQDMEKADTEDVKKRTSGSAKKKEDATKRYTDYENKVKEIELENTLNKKAKERLDLQDQLNAATEKYEKGLEILGGQEQDATMATEAFEEMSKLEDQIKQNGMSIDEASDRMKKFGDVTEQTGKKGSSAFSKIGSGIKTAGKHLKNFAKQMAIMYAVTVILEAVTDLIGGIADLFDSAVETAEEAQEEFETLNSELSSVKSELSSLNSELKTTQDRIDELIKQGSLSFAEQEELSNLRATNAELERKIALNKTLEESLQKQVNSASTHATDMYLGTSFGSELSKTERQEESAETGGKWGKYGGAAAGAAIGTAIAPGIGTLIGLAIGAFVGEPIGEAVGSAVEGAAYDAEQTVGDALDNMVAQRDKLQSAQNEALAAGDAEAYNEAAEALAAYDKQMAKHITQIQANYNAMDWSKATTEERAAMIEQADSLDKYNIAMGATGAKTNAIDRIFGENAEGGFARARTLIDELKEKLKEAQESGDELAIADALKDLENFKLEGILSDKEIERLRNIGIYLYEAEDRFQDVVQTESKFVNNDLEDVAKDIAKITDQLGSLKSAFDEVIDKGYITSKTLLNLKEELGVGAFEADGVESVTDAWREYTNIMMSGTASTNEMTVATEKLAQAWVEAKLADNNFKPENKNEIITQLKDLGVENAAEYVEDLLQKNMVKDLQEGMVPDRSVVERHVSEASGGVDMRAEVDAWSDEDLQRYAKEHGLINTEITEAHKKEIMERYGIEEEAIDALILKLEEQARLQTELDELKNKQNDYDTWDDGLQAVKQDLDTAKQAMDDYVAMFDVPVDLETFNPDNYSFWSENKGYYNEKDGTYLSTAHFNDLKKYYAEYAKFKSQYDALWAEGESKGYIIDGKVVNPKFQSEIDNVTTELDGIKTEIEEELTFDVKLKLDLQDKSELVDDIQNTFDTLKNAQKEYNENGYLTVDTLQSLLQLEPKYLDLLVDEAGNINLTEQALYDVARARIIDMGIQQQKNILEKAMKLASEGSSEALREEIEVMQNANETGQDFVAIKMMEIQAILDKKVAAGELTKAEADAFITGTMNQIKAVRAAMDVSLGQLENTLSSAGNTAKAETEDAFQKAMEYWENRIGANQARYEQIQNEIDLLEAKGQKAGAGYYQEQIELENDRLWLLEQQKAEAERFLATFAEGSDQWWEAANTLNSIEGELDSVTASIVDLQDAIGEIEIYKFDEFNNRLDDIISKLGTIRDLIAPGGEEDWFDDQGQWTEEGVAVLGTYIQELETYKNGLAEVNAERAKYEKSYTGNEDYYAALGIHSEQEYYDRVQELTEQQYDYAQSISDTEQSVVDMYESNIDAVEEYTETLIDSYNDYVDSVKEALDAERDYTL